MADSKVIKKLGPQTVEEMNAMNEVALRQVIVEASASMKQAKEELEALPAYQSVKADLLALTQGKKELDSRQKARVSYALELLEEAGK